MVKEYWERIDKEINDAIFRAVILTWPRNIEYVKVIDLLIVIRESERKRLEIRRIKNE